ncbi:unnamed protein product [Mycena citricolor]|uniref:Uncharacterized protein n=1 Tax=Mycena citricolor TaxID=2018698 RepID=A0AAD2H9P3_9AGAR|nr:unnamed protein product [Mycena citricolor]
MNRPLSGEKTNNAEDPERLAVLGGASTAAYSSSSLSDSRQKIDGIEDKLSVPINSTNDTYTTLQTFYTTNAAVINTASSALAATADIDVKSIEATIARFAETSAVIMKGLDALGAVHPFVGVAVTAFKLVISLDITRRQNNKKVLAVKLQMQDLMTVLFQLLPMRDPEDKAPDGTTLKDRMSELMKTVADDITSCGSACDVYLKKSFLGEYPPTPQLLCADTLSTAKTIKSKIYEARLASYVAKFTDHKKSIAFVLTMDTSHSVGTANRKLDDITTQLDSIEMKMGELFRKLDTPREREVQKFLDDNGGARACISDDAALAQLVAKSGDTTLASGTSAEITATKTLLLRELSEDIDEAFRKNALLFDRKMEIQSQELKIAMKDGEERLRKVIKEGLHERIMDKGLQTLWKDQGWKGSVKARHFVLALNDYYSDLYSKHLPESRSSSAPPTPMVPTINLIAELPSVPKYEDDDHWALNQSKPILETVDDDGTGFVTIKETNEFTESRPKEQCRHVPMSIKKSSSSLRESSSLLSWTAYWAAGWHTSVTWHKNRIYSLLRAMLNLPTSALKPILPANIQRVDTYLASLPMRRIELLLRSTRSAGPERDENLAKVREKIEGHENKRIQDRLTKLRYELDDVGLRLITGNKRIERFIYPLLEALLKRHFDILRLACVHVLDDSEFDTMTGSLGVIFEAVDERVANLEAVFKSNFSNVNERFGRFAFGMFQADYTSDKTYSDVVNNTISVTLREEGYEFDVDSEDTDFRGYSLDAFKSLDDKRKDILMYPTANGVGNLYDFHLKHPDPSAEAGDHLALAGRWTGHIMYQGLEYSGLISLVLSVDAENTLSGASEIFDQILKVSGSASPGEDSQAEITLIIWLSETLVFNCKGVYNADKDIIEGHLDTSAGVTNTFTFIFHRTPAEWPESYRFRPSPTAENRAVARWHFAINAVLDQFQRRNMSWRWLKARFAERRRFIHLMTRNKANDRGLTPWAPLSDGELAELRNLLSVLTSADTRFYLTIVELELRKVVDQYRICDVCKKDIRGPLLFCVQCIDNKFDECSDFCEVHTEKSVQWETVTHRPSHVSVKTLSRIHHGDKSWVVPKARSVAARIKKLFKELDAPESAKTVAEIGYGFNDAVAEKKRPKCVCCAKDVSLPVWVCLACDEDIFVCIECDKAKQSIPEESIPKYQDLVKSGKKPCHMLSDPLVYVHDTEPIPPLAQSMTNERRIAELDKKMTTMEQRMTTMEQRMTGIEEKLDAIIKALAQSRNCTIRFVRYCNPAARSGVQIAVSGGLTAAVTIAASIRGHCTEEEAGNFHHHKVAVSYTRFFLTVSGAYKQIRSQQVPVLSDIDEGNFDRAFDLIRPVIQGSADAGRLLTEDELQKAMDFVSHIFTPTDPEMMHAVGTKLQMDVLAPGAPIFTPAQIAALAHGDEDTVKVLNQAKTTRAVYDFDTGPDRPLGEMVDGFIGCTRVGSVGLVCVSEGSRKSKEKEEEVGGVKREHTMYAQLAPEPQVAQVRRK